MVPPTPRRPSQLRTAHNILGQCDEICGRLSIWCAARQPHDEPLTTLLCNHIEGLAAHVRSLKLDVEGISDADGQAVPADLVRTLDCTKLLLVETLDRQNFYSREERRGHDGALNALFASRFILGPIAYPESARAYYNEDKLIRIGFELKELVDELVSLPVCLRGGRFREDVVRALLPKFEHFYAKVERQFRPRYVHTYDSFPNAPYTIDVAALPSSGSFGVVRKFYRRRDGEAVAIKTFSRVLHDEATRKILREIGILEVCDHKNIVQLIEAFTTEDARESMHLVITPWAPCTLQDFLHMADAARANRCAWFQPRSVVSDRCICRIMFELADAVDYLHNKSIKHKDIKPENLLLYLEGSAAHVRPLITDFGVSKVFTKGAMTNYTDSTRIYLAPEQLEKESSTLKADVWQLGCCFAELLALAIGGSSAYAVLLDSYRSSYSVAKEYVPFMDALSNISMLATPTLKPVYGIVTRMLESCPSRRADIGWVRATLLAAFRL